MKKIFYSPIFLLIFLSFYPAVSFGKIKLTLNLVQKDGVDNSLFLVNEIYSSVIMLEGESTTLKLKNGIEFEVSAKVPEDSDKSKIIISTNVFRKKEEKKTLLLNPKRETTFGHAAIVHLQDGRGMPINLTVTPELLYD
ncbi:MAG: hypothetical protein U0T83_08580 [Bacteriovoracaceae bacterium]